jgi:hypothetical protein
MRHTPSRSILFPALAAALLGGCSVKPKPPVYSLYQHQRLVVLPFENLSRDPALAQDLQDGVVAELVRLKAVPVAEEGQVVDFLRKRKADLAGLSENAALRAQLAQALKADVVLVGSVKTFTESYTEEAPHRRKVKSEPETYEWGFYTEERVTATGTLRLVDAAGGNIRWIQNVTSNRSNRQWHPLGYEAIQVVVPQGGWDPYLDKVRPAHARRGKGRKAGRGGDLAEVKDGKVVVNINIQNNQNQTQTQSPAAASAAPPLLYESDSVFQGLRQAAVRDLVAYAVSDFRGRGGWTPGLATGQ